MIKKPSRPKIQKLYESEQPSYSDYGIKRRHPNTLIIWVMLIIIFSITLMWGV